MTFKSRINELRRRVLRSITKNIGYTTFENNICCETGDIKRILICRPNSRLGNQLLITPLVEEISLNFPDCKIDLFVRGGLSNIIFENYTNVDRIIKLPKKPFKDLIQYLKVWLSLRKYYYDMVINVGENSSSGRISTQITRSKYKFFNNHDNLLNSTYSDYHHIAKNPVYNLRKCLNLDKINRPIPKLDLKLTEEELHKGKQRLDSIVSSNKHTISIYTFATGEKCFSEVWWATVYSKLKEKFENEFNILEVLPIENVSQINFQAPSFYSKDIREIGGLIANTEIFIGADCGIMHLSSASQTTTIGLFSKTNSNIYEPYSNNSVALDTNNLSAEKLIEEIDTILKHKKSILSRKNF